MPHFQVADAYGHTWQCASSDPELLGRWLIEAILRAAPDPTYAHVMPLQIRVFPMSNADGSPDWPREDWTVIGSADSGQPASPADLVRKVIGWLQTTVDRGDIV